MVLDVSLQHVGAKRFKDFLAKVLKEEPVRLKCKIIEIGIKDDNVHLVIATSHPFQSVNFYIR